MQDIIFIIQWWVMFFIIGVIFLPITTLIFKNFFDKGYIFSKILGIAFISYLVFLLGIIKILPFTFPTILFVLGFFALLNVLILKKNLKSTIEQLNNLPIIFLFEEALFLAALFFWSYIRSFQPDVHGLEKYMDYGFVNSILRSNYFPPMDMWFPPFPINYYYFGHLVTAVLTKLSNISSNISYNLMLSTIFALTFTGAFSIGANLYRGVSQIKTQIRADRRSKSALISGFLTAILVTFAGNLQAIYSFFKPYAETPVPFWNLQFLPNTFPNSYWYPNATRFIQNTIHEFPIYSFVVSDLHGHVLDIPFVLLAIALLLSVFKNLSIKNSFRVSIFDIRILLLAFLLAVIYMTNAWDGIIYFLLSALILFYFKKSSSIFFLFGFFLIFSFPFSLNFKPFASGIGVLCAPDFLTNIGKIGPFLFEKDHCQRSPFWQLMILYGFFYFWAISFIVFLKSKLNARRYTLNPSDIFILILIFLSTFLIIIPEFIYIKDIYPAHYRANTMFKLVYQSFIMLSISSSYIIMKLILNFKKGLFTSGYLLVASCLTFLVMTYPYFAIDSYYGSLKTYKGLDGIYYLNNLYPNDYQAILWINKNMMGQPVILEAQGDSYTDYARVSANTGLPTVVGWPVHEWLWRGTYDIPAPRITDVQTLYETDDLEIAKNLIGKYDIEFIFLGDLERQKYTKLNESKFEELGTLIFQMGQTKIYQVTDK